MSPESPESPETISGKGREKESGKSGISIDTGLWTSPVLSQSEPIRILLSKAASDALTATGEGAFAIVHKVMRGVEEPDTIGRWAIYLAPVAWPTATAATSVLCGKARAVKIKPVSPSPK
jgi:hypothetical protein